MNDFHFKSIGTIYTPFASPKDTPIQPSCSNAEGYIEVVSHYTEALSDLDGFEHIWLLYAFHQSRDFSPKVIPFRDNEKRGLFATRAPVRANPIGMSVVQLININRNRINIKNVDMLNQTPLLDIKPYVPEFDIRENSKAGWLDRHRNNRQIADDRFEQ